MSGDIPYVQYGAQEDLRSLYYSDPMAALKVPVTLKAGYGVLPKGSCLALDKSAGSSGLLVPYSLTSFSASASEYVTGRAYLVADVGAAANVLYVNLNDSYKFAVGDDLIINDNATSAENLGAITAIDRTTYSHMAKITVTTATSGTFETSAYGYVIVEAGTSGNNYSDCVGILEKTVDTGIGSNAKGAVATMIIGNCVLYEGVLLNIDAAAKTDISAASFGQYLYIR
jgi:hypothetical protein